MKIHCIIHTRRNIPCYYEKWAEDNGLEYGVTHVVQNEPLPQVHDFDILVSMGGPQCALNLHHYPYLQDEIALIKQAIEQDKKVLGICLGAQLVAESYGANAERSPHKEIGVFPLSLTPEAQEDPIFKDFPSQFPSGHWHHDMLGLPEGATVLAQSAGCPRQIVRFSPKVYGFQCHLELNQKKMQWLLENCQEDLTPTSPYVQHPETILSHNYEVINQHLDIFLQKFILE